VAESDETRVETDQRRGRSPRDLRALIEAERSGLPFVYWRDSAGDQHILMLSGVRARLTVGRHEHSDIALTWEATVSRAHAVIESIGDDWTLLDNGISQNGSFVNESLVHGRRRLNDKDRMCFGDTHVVFRDPGAGRGSAPLACTAEPPKGIRFTKTKRAILVALCRPIAEHRSSTPATDPQISDEVSLTVDAVSNHLRELFAQFGLAEVPQNERRGRLAATVLRCGLLSQGDF
jgi:pSer/pThr/pTyr-binding forkhead associated (FHA) protein